VRVTILGSSGAIARGQYTTSFQIDHDLLIDAGTGLGLLTLESLARIDHVLLTHAHLDHVACLPLMLDSVGGLRQRPVCAHGLPATLKTLRDHVFNDQLWPDFTRIPPQRPFIELQPLEVGQQLSIGPHRVRVLPARHSVPGVGYAIETPRGWWVYTGDTVGCPEFWQAIDELELAMIVIETAFMDAEQTLANLAQHLTPRSLLRELTNLPPRHRHVPIAIMHNKPADMSTIRHEITQGWGARSNPLVWLESEMTLEF
jgi:cAMP phosphodiesterase